MSNAVALAPSVPATVAAPDPFLEAIRNWHRTQDLVEEIGHETVLAAHPGLAAAWPLRARRAQLPPLDLERIWVLLGGRGAGKTISLTNAVHLAVQAGIKRIGLIAPTTADVRDVLIEGPAGILAMTPPGMPRPVWTETKRRLLWSNGARATTYSAEEPEFLRGHEFELCLADEIAAMDYGEDVWDQLSLCARIGAYPRILAATTPKPKPWIKKLIKEPGVFVTHSTTWENEKNLSPSYMASLRQTWEGRKLALQELEGLFVEEEDTELFKEAWLIYDPVPDAMIEFVSVAVDPGETDVTGIVAAGYLSDGRFAVLADRSLKASAAGWAREVIRLADEFEALGIDTDISIETNWGGDSVAETLRGAALHMAAQGEREDSFVRIHTVHATKGKQIRAAPISGLFEQGKVLLRPGLNALVAELLNFSYGWNRQRDGSPNRLDAMVWALHRLLKIKTITMA